MILRLNKLFKKSPDAPPLARAAYMEGNYHCDSCGHSIPLADAEPLTFRPCPKCGYKVLVPYLLKDYLLFEPLGAGGVSSVYKAYHRRDYVGGTLYAVKILRSDRTADESQLADFLFDGLVHQAVSPHPHIVRFVEQGHEGDEHFHAMEYIPGLSVKHIVENSGRIPEKTALQWLGETVSALRHIYQKGFLYRDISPGNLLVRKDHSVCLIDFGMALPLEEADAPDESRFVVGTPEYIPPERIQHLGEEMRSSIYSLGMVLYFMLKGETLIKGSSQERMALQHVSTLRVAFNEWMLPPDCSPNVVALLAPMTQTDPENRPATFDDVLKLINAT